MKRQTFLGSYLSNEYITLCNHMKKVQIVSVFCKQKMLSFAAKSAKEICQHHVATWEYVPSLA
jgi:hypothetical protein